MDNSKKCKKCDEVKDKKEFSGRSLTCKYCTNQNSIKQKEEKALIEGRIYKYRPRLEYDPNKTSKICTKCDEEKELNEFYTNNSQKDGYTSRCITCLCRKKIVSDVDTISKICKTCNIRKELLEFPKGDCKLGCRNKCKKCYSITKKIYRDNRIISDNEKLKLKEYHKKYREENKDIINEKLKEYRIENKDIINEKLRYYYINNKDKFKHYNYIYYRKPGIKDKKIERNRNYTKHRRKTDMSFNLKENIRTSIGNSFRNNGYSKKSKTHEILGCSYEDFKLYLESKFEDWMTWENKAFYNGELNYGWDMDHIIPISSANNEEEIVKLNHYTNFQPLCSFINRNIKRDRIDY